MAGLFLHTLYLKNEANFSEKTFYLYRTLFNTPKQNLEHF